MTPSKLFTEETTKALVPLDKKLSSEWVQSLTDRGIPEIYEKESIQHIGMPIGGLFAGQVYLGGDGSLWHWDIFNEFVFTGAEHYANPLVPDQRLEQKFELQIDNRSFSLNKDGFKKITFRGEYPVGTVHYEDSEVPLKVMMEAYSPFIPLNVEDSSLPATILDFTVRNTSDRVVEAKFKGHLENALLRRGKAYYEGTRRLEWGKGSGQNFLSYSVHKSEGSDVSSRPDRTVEDWNKADYTGWRVEGDAFGESPLKRKDVSWDLGQLVRENAAYLIDSHVSAPGSSAEEKDSRTGKLTSHDFDVDRNFLNLWVGGGNCEGKTEVRVIIDGVILGRASGRNSHEMRLAVFDLRKCQGKKAHIEIEDSSSIKWGSIIVGRIYLTDIPFGKRFEKLDDYGTMVLGAVGEKPDLHSPTETVPLNQKLVGTVGYSLSLRPDEEKKMRFVIAWHFPNLDHIPLIKSQGRWYSSRYKSAEDVFNYIAAHHERLSKETFLWRNNWYDSSLPFWFLDRTLINASILATSTCYRFEDGRPWFWEGVGSCPGTCGHVWYYGQSTSRLFPEIEREHREKVDFTISQKEDGSIGFRGENGLTPAIDSQSGYVLMVWREHLMSVDGEFLKRIWPQVKKATMWLIQQDVNRDGLIKGAQHNTLDTDWFGASAWLSGIYQASLHASIAMANEMNDTDFQTECQNIVNRGKESLVKELFNGEYFQNKGYLEYPESINSGSGCLIDQVMGQSWAFQVGLPRVFPKKETLDALKSLWNYNYTPDVGLYREINKPGRWYAMPGEAGLLMCTFPNPDWDYIKAKGTKGRASPAGYFNECMNGFEYQVAGHMIWEGMIQEGLAIIRSIHDRYGASKRNPYNEIECGDHYGRSTASYGVFLAACGYAYHGPEKSMEFSPKINPHQFKSAFTAAEGWGSFHQEIQQDKSVANLTLKWGRLKLKQFTLGGWGKGQVGCVTLNGKHLSVTMESVDGKSVVKFCNELEMSAGDILSFQRSRTITLS